MSFSILEYVLPPMLTFLIGGLISVSISICTFIRYRYILKKKEGKKLLALQNWLLVLIAVVTLFCLSSMNRWSYLLDHTNRAIDTGVVERIRPAPTVSVYYSTTERCLCHPSIVEVSGKEYYILSSTGLEPGMEIWFLYGPKGQTIIKWALSEEKLGNVIPSENRVFQPFAIQKAFSNTTLLTVYFGILLAFAVFHEPLRRKQESILRAHEIISDGVVAPKMIEFANSPVEYVTTFFALLSFWGSGVPLRCIWCLAVLSFWTHRFFELGRYVIFNQGDFQYVVFGAGEHLSGDDISKFGWVKVKGIGQISLFLKLRSGRIITFSQNHFSGLPQFYNWLCALTDNQESEESVM